MKFYSLFFLFFAFVFTINGQIIERDFPLKLGASVSIENLYGRVSIAAQESEETTETRAFVKIESAKELKDSEVVTKNEDGKLEIVVKPQDFKTRIDLIVKIPVRSKVSVTTRDGEVAVAGNLEKINITTDTGTISTDVPTDDLRYDLTWTRSRPRFLSDIQLEEVKEKAAGKFGINGKFGETQKERAKRLQKEGKIAVKNDDEAADSDKADAEKETKNERRIRETLAEKRVELNLTTGRGIVLLNVPPGEVPADLSERKLTEAAKSIVRSGDSVLSEAIRRASPKFFAEYARTLPPRRTSPTLALNQQQRISNSSRVKQVIARVMDANNRSLGGLQKEDFTVTEGGTEREIISVRQTNAPFNLVLLLDVSGSVDNYVNFLRKAARQFLDTTSPNDKVSIIIFSEDVKQISTFTTDKSALSESLDTFDAGGATAYYDALAYTLVDTLRPLKGERTAIIALTDGDDNRSFLPFESLLGSIQESGALIYPLYVPSSLAAASSSFNPETTADPLRNRYLGLTSKAEAEGAKLAQVSGGVYYPIQRLGDLQKAYDDIVEQLRTAYTITFRSDGVDTGNTASPRLRIKTNRENTVVTTGQVFNVSSQSNLLEKFRSSPIISRVIRQKSLFNYASFSLKYNFQQPDEVSGNVEKIKYKQSVNDKLRESAFGNFDINKAQGAFLVNDGKEIIAVSRWISPKRTRSYPYERVYDTLAHAGKKVAIIPVVKDEGLGGERDFLQWDTISLLSLLDVHVILAYYDSAEKNMKRNDQITSQKFDNNYIKARLAEIFSFSGNPREWNERETKQLKNVFEKAKLSYQRISKETGTYLHDSTALDELINYAETPQKFLEFSRKKSQKAQGREFVTDQPKEALSTDTKAKVTINNALFGKYFFTCDETKIENKTVYLIEAKHSVRGKMPSKNDIKDGFIKMMLYTNLADVKIGATPFNSKAQIRLTANQLKGSINSDSGEESVTKFLSENLFDTANANFIKKIFEEAKANNFTIILEHAETAS